jgi:predicted DNA-binding transcriptional regulator AlpA
MSVRAGAAPATRLVPKRGLSRAEAAQYVGIGSTKFDELVATGRMPKPKRIDSRKVWDIQELDMAFDALPGDTDTDNTWSDVGAA